MFNTTRTKDSLPLSSQANTLEYGSTQDTSADAVDKHVNPDAENDARASEELIPPVTPELPPLPRWQKMTLWTGVILTYYVNGLDNFTMTVYLQYAATEFNGLVQWTTLSVINSMILAVGKPIYAKMADVFGRAYVWLLSLAFYTIGTLVVASAQGINTLAAGVIFWALGNCGVSFSQQLILADLVPPRWRGLVSNSLTLHFVINFGVSSKITAALVPDHWRWGVSMFTILNPIALCPIIFVLGLQQRAAVKAGLIHKYPYHGLSIKAATREFIADIDIIGSLCFVGGFLLLLLPLTIANLAPNGYSTGYIIAMFVLGALLLIAWPLVELYVASRPLIRLRSLFTNLDVILPCAIYFLDEWSTTMTMTPLYSWALIVFGWEVDGATYYYYTQSLCLVVFGVVAGAIVVRTRRYKWITVTGSCCRLLGLGLMYRFRSGNASTVQAVIPQVIQGMGGGLMTANLVVAAQAAVPHAETAVVTGFILLVVSLGSGIGSAVVGGVQQNLLGELHTYVDPIAGNSTLAVEIYDSGVSALADYPIGTAIRSATIEAWAANMHQIIIGALVVAVINVAASVALRDVKLSADKQNNVEDAPIQSLVPMAVLRDYGTTGQAQEDTRNVFGKGSSAAGHEA